MTDKGQLISEANFQVLFEPKTKLKYFCISALASRIGEIKKQWPIRMLIIWLSSNMIICNWFFDLTHFRELGQIYRNILVRFLVQMKSLKFVSEIN